MGLDKLQFNCTRCPAYCCSYPRISVTKADVVRIAKHLGLDPDTVEKRFTKPDTEEKGRIMRHRRDEHFGSVCRFLDRETRACTLYDARPRICRAYPGTRRCGYYDFLSFERRALRDPDHVAITWRG